MGADVSSGALGLPARVGTEGKERRRTAQTDEEASSTAAGSGVGPVVLLKELSRQAAKQGRGRGLRRIVSRQFGPRRGGEAAC